MFGGDRVSARRADGRVLARIDERRNSALWLISALLVAEDIKLHADCIDNLGHFPQGRRSPVLVHFCCCRLAAATPWYISTLDWLSAYLRRGAQLAAHKYADAMVRQPDYFPDKSKKSLPVFLVPTAIHSDNFIEIHRKLSDITPTVQSGEGGDQGFCRTRAIRIMIQIILWS